MPIDWFTVGAQALNFLILIWLMKRFLYQPILNGLDSREQKINDILTQAKNTQTQAEVLKAEFDQKMQQIQHQREGILKTARQEANNERELLLNKAQEAADDMLKKRLESLQYELQHLHQHIVHKNIEEVYAISRKALLDLADSSIEHAMLQHLLKRLQGLEEEQLHELLNALSRTDNEIGVRSAFALSDEQKLSIQQAMDEKLSPLGDKPLRLNFTVIPPLINGIELTISGWKLAWSVNSYLQTLQHSVATLSNIVPSQPHLSGLSKKNGKTIGL